MAVEVVADSPVVDPAAQTAPAVIKTLFVLPVSDEFGWVLLVVTALVATVYFMGFAVYKRRRFVMKEEYLEQFTTQHMEAFPGQQKASVEGFPDTGSGRYSAVMSYSDWLTFNNAQRGHLNSIEQLPFLVGGLLFIGFAFPLTAAIMGALLVPARIAYFVGYTNYGPKARLPGILLEDLIKLGMIGLIVATCVQSF